jgi:hypothetical protein
LTHSAHLAKRLSRSTASANCNQRAEQIHRLQTQLRARLVLPKEQSRIDVLAQMRVSLPLYRGERGHHRVVIGTHLAIVLGVVALIACVVLSARILGIG